MPVNIYAPTAQDTLSAAEAELYNLIMDYRVANGLSVIPLSEGLTVTAGRHAIDSYENIFKAGLTLPDGANLHSWSDAPYFDNHSLAANMWTAPQRLGTSYGGDGYEVSAWGFTTAADALNGWDNSPLHKAQILEGVGWEGFDWTSIGVGVEQHNDYRIYHVWFGDEVDPAGAPDIQGNNANNVIDATGFADTIYGGGGSDTLLGGDGADYLGGGTGADRMDGGRGNDFFVVDNAGDVVVETLAYSAGGGIDTVRSYVNYTQPDNVELVRLATKANTADLNATGNDAPGTLVGNAGDNVLTGRGGNDQINGNNGDDRLVGNTGRDTLVGGGGADTFVYSSISESRVGIAERDVINGFDRGADHIDLSAMDANLGGAGDVAFEFIGTSRFSGEAGELRLQSLGGSNAVLVEGDLRGDGVADFQIFVNLRINLSADDFIL